MTKHEPYWRRFAERAALAAALAAVGACGETRRARVGETIEMGTFRVRVESIEVEDRRHQGVAVEVRVRLSVDGGNRFERMDFADRLNRERIYLRAEDGWRERLYGNSAGADARGIELAAYPGKDRSGYRLSIGNPHGGPSRVEVELGR
jgi:hypothetical protein